MEKPFRPIVDHIKEKAPAYALAVVVGVGSLALMGEGDGEDPSHVTDPQAAHQDAPNHPEDVTAPQFLSFDEFRAQQMQQESVEDR